ncbi:MAG TPA: hypothetical protein VFD73_07315, partial [Gemmatimonadales bacterium]|nr:hypothetical protein [Gemmatimonadales bacterium]
MDLVAVAAAVFVLDHVAGCGQVGDDTLRSVMSRLAAMSRSRPRVAGDAQQHPGVAGQEAPSRHPENL